MRVPHTIYSTWAILGAASANSPQTKTIDLGLCRGCRGCRGIAVTRRRTEPGKPCACFPDVIIIMTLVAQGKLPQKSFTDFNQAPEYFSRFRIDPPKGFREVFARFSPGFRQVFARFSRGFRFENIFVKGSGEQKKINFCVPRGPPPHRGRRRTGAPAVIAKIGKNRDGPVGRLPEKLVAKCVDMTLVWTSNYF